MEDIAVQFATTPAGQWTCNVLDLLLVNLKDAAMWTLEGSQSFHWIIFLPLLAIVQWTRLVVSAALLIFKGKIVSKDDLKNIIEPAQEKILSIKERGMQRQDELNKKIEYVKLEDFALYRKTNTCLLRPISWVVKNALFVFGLVPKSALNINKNKTSNEEESSTEAGSEEEQQNQEQQYHHENHY